MRSFHLSFSRRVCDKLHSLTRPIVFEALRHLSTPTMASEHPSKRQKLDGGETTNAARVRMQRAAFLSSMSRDISPPPSARATPDVQVVETRPVKKPVIDLTPEVDEDADRIAKPKSITTRAEHGKPQVLPSPFTLTKIRDLPASRNNSTISLHSILGNPLIREAWIFNFCFDVDWLLQFFDSDIRSIIPIKIIHGSWRNEDSNRIGIDDACRRYSNVEHAKAYLPDQFGTHHSKMFVLFTQDDRAEVIIHTANMLMKDWTNMSQGVWRSGALPKSCQPDDGLLGKIGSGERFKYDLLSYLREYNKPCRDLVKELQEYNFSSVRGALVASVPCRIENAVESTRGQHLWGYPQLREVLNHIHQTRNRPTSTQGDEKPHLVAQVSSIASLPSGWVKNFLASTRPSSPTQRDTAPSNLSSPTAKSNISPVPTDTRMTQNSPLSIIYPTPQNVASSLDGYAAGGSIHTKAQLSAHIKQIDSLRPYLCQWTKGPLPQYSAGRDDAAPHIKTYVQFNQKPTTEALEAGAGEGGMDINWALLTSANLSTQAWGSLPGRETKWKKGCPKSVGQKGIVHIQSFEIGVLVWPELFSDTFADEGEKVEDEEEDEDEGEESLHVAEADCNGAVVDDVGMESKSKKRRGGVRMRMIPVFPNGSTTSTSSASPTTTMRRQISQHTAQQAATNGSRDEIVVELALPYDLPLTPYTPTDMPWSPGGTYMVPDRHGAIWKGGGGR
jgi:tyrosyl-DNA phosphodiesterase 1